jgi:hypothetical protein
MLPRQRLTAAAGTLLARGSPQIYSPYDHLRTGFTAISAVMIILIHHPRNSLVQLFSY